VTIQSQCAEGASKDFRQQIMDQWFEHGTVIYRVHDERSRVIGDIVLTGDFVASAHGDSMHFKHQRVSCEVTEAQNRPRALIRTGMGEMNKGTCAEHEKGLK